LWDFNGCGNSEGDYVTLGLGESEDGIQVLDELHTTFLYSKVFLWGKSMGAVTAMYIARYCDE